MDNVNTCKNTDARRDRQAVKTRRQGPSAQEYIGDGTQPDAQRHTKQPPLRPVHTIPIGDGTIWTAYWMMLPVVEGLAIHSVRCYGQRTNLIKVTGRVHAQEDMPQEH